jgi:hypothetical protein
VRDGIALARRGIPVVALVTEDFWPQGNFVARAFGMPEVPRVELPHPVAGTGDEAMKRVAAAIVPRILQALRGQVKGEVKAGVADRSEP